MVFHQLTFIKTATAPSEYPADLCPEVVFLGRSNAGKSTLINLLSQKKIAKVSQTPGKTRALQFFSAGKTLRVVDVPGYGWSARSGTEMETWQNMVEEYMVHREDLRACILVRDVRRELDDLDKMMIGFLKQLGKPWATVLTKSDQIRGQKKPQPVQHPHNPTFVSIYNDEESVDPLARWILSLVR